MLDRIPRLFLSRWALSPQGFLHFEVRSRTKDRTISKSKGDRGQAASATDVRSLPRKATVEYSRVNVFEQRSPRTKARKDALTADDVLAALHPHDIAVLDQNLADFLPDSNLHSKLEAMLMQCIHELTRPSGKFFSH